MYIICVLPTNLPKLRVLLLKRIKVADPSWLSLMLLRNDYIIIIKTVVLQ
jgi:hypothetical protein